MGSRGRYPKTKRKQNIAFHAGTINRTYVCLGTTYSVFLDNAG
jgi:hypothetical protein